MSRLVNALQSLELDATVELGGRWITLEGEGCRVYVVQGTADDGFYTWCDAPGVRSVEFFRDPVQAIVTGLQRGAQQGRAGIASDPQTK